MYDPSSSAQVRMTDFCVKKAETRDGELAGSGWRGKVAGQLGITWCKFRHFDTEPDISVITTLRCDFPVLSKGSATKCKLA
eukprot:COSAG02_NODE_5802_length_4026_cov_4.072320_1_plen_81_part_00